MPAYQMGITEDTIIDFTLLAFTATDADSGAYGKHHLVKTSIGFLKYCTAFDNYTIVLI